MDYVDTSALLKGYLIEPATPAFILWLAEQGDAVISPLSVVEFKCAIRRRERAGQLTRRRAKAILDRLDENLADESLGRVAWREQAFMLANDLIDRVAPVALRTLDALHLAVALQHRCTGFATADRAQADAARRLGFAVHTFLPSE
ncbi:MAG: type II toxin-antitoxin system VapC family toxin [Burkholderiaceae bacterium]